MASTAVSTVANPVIITTSSRATAPDLAEQVEPALAWHLEVGEHQIEVLLLEHLDRLGGRGGGHHLVPLVLEQIAQFLPDTASSSTMRRRTSRRTPGA